MKSRAGRRCLIAFIARTSGFAFMQYTYSVCHPINKTPFASSNFDWLV